MKNRFRLILRNPLGLIGFALVLVSVGAILVFTLIGLTSKHGNPYASILAFVVAPAFLLLALILVAIGYKRERRTAAAEISGEAVPYPHVDLNVREQRRRALGFILLLGVLVVLGATGSYKGYECAESVSFCGNTCHTVMHPEYTAYQYSSHARVACVDCHVGSGANWYVKSKLSGTRQVFAAAFKTYPRPIPTPVHNLRPAPETCEQCHWPKKFYGAQLKVFTHYASDEANTPRRIQMLVRTGGGDPASGAPAGIHWHMNIENRVEYLATDDQRQIIPYVRIRNMQGQLTEYYAQDSKLSKDQIKKLTLRLMDCVDCHNRPTHIFMSPDQAVDQSLLTRRLDASLPYLKQQSVAALVVDYKTTDAALIGISKSIREFYQNKYPDLAKPKDLAISDAVDELQRIYQRTTFPEMKVNWQTHPNNIGHLYFNGCFRCHDGQHVSDRGQVIPKDCDTCHTVMHQQEGAAQVAMPIERKFQHPVDIGDLTQVTCTDCHTGGASP